jgi:DNA-binding MarR family transcriptional regulator
MAVETDTREAAGALRFAIGSLVRRLRLMHPEGGLSMAESSALAVLDREGPTTSSVLAKREQITPQSMGVTLAALETRGLVRRRPDPNDGRRAVMSLTRSGRDVVLRRRDASTDLIARSLAANFTTAEIEQLHAAAALIERLARVL